MGYEISREEWEAMQKRVAELEKKQKSSAEMVANYILDSESSSSQLSDRIDRLVIEIPVIVQTAMIAALKNNGLNERDTKVR